MSEASRPNSTSRSWPARRRVVGELAGCASSADPSPGSWGDSLQLRVAATTAVVTGVVVLIIGLFLVNEISAGVLRAKRTSAIAQAQVGLSTLRTQMAGVDAGDISGHHDDDQRRRRRR